MIDTHMLVKKKKNGTCASNKISVDSVPCDPVRSNHRNHKCGESCRPDPKYTNSNLAMIFPEFSKKKKHKTWNLVQLFHLGKVVTK